MQLWTKDDALGKRRIELMAPALAREVRSGCGQKAIDMLAGAVVCGFATVDEVCKLTSQPETKVSEAVALYRTAYGNGEKARFSASHTFALRTPNNRIAELVIGDGKGGNQVFQLTFNQVALLAQQAANAIIAWNMTPGDPRN